MGRFYEQNPSMTTVLVRRPNGTSKSVEVSKSVYTALEDMQREYWRTERREARHTLSLDAMETQIAIAEVGSDPVERLIDEYNRRCLARALSSLSTIQLRRFLMHAVAQVSIKEIAAQESCSERAVKYSLSKARKKMRKVLSRGFPS